MPALSVYVDDSLIVTVRCDGLDVVAVRVSGTRIEDAFASLDVSGGVYPETGESASFIWVDNVPLEPGQNVRVLFLESGATSAPGKTIEELFPKEEPGENFDLAATAQMFEELKAQPEQRSGYSFEYVSPEGKKITAHTAPAEHGFGFTVLWNPHRPSRASVSLSSYSIDNLQHRESGHCHAHEHLPFGQAVAIRINS